MNIKTPTPAFEPVFSLGGHLLNGFGNPADYLQRKPS
jgi:hypothetical protein